MDMCHKNHLITDVVAYEWMKSTNMLYVHCMYNMSTTCNLMSHVICLMQLRQKFVACVVCN
jgi:hypothetical protein